MISNNIPKSPLIALWHSLKTNPSGKRSLQISSKAILTSFENSYQQSAQAVNWMIENRGGLAKLAGLAIVPAQYIANDHISSNKIIDKHLGTGLRNGRMEKIAIPMGNGNIEGVICYPKDWKKNDNSRCIIYHNPNGVALVGFFQNGKLSWTPGEIFENRNCPIILYDYRGVGLNQDIITKSSLKFHATYESIVADGQAALDYALNKFHKVEVMGTSLGGGVATVSLDLHLTAAPLDANRITQLINHDSFTTTPRVIFPNQPWFADCLGHIIGANLDAMTPMKNLINRGIKVTVLYHTKDPVIPFGARMGDFVQTLPKKANATAFASPHYGHANLSSDMVDIL